MENTQTSSKQIANGVLTFTLNVKQLNMLNMSQSVSLDQKSKTQLCDIYKKYTLKSKISWQQKYAKDIPYR